MNPNELLEIKWEAQRKLMAKAEASGKDYLDVVDEEAQQWFAESGLTIQYVRHEHPPFTAPRGAD